MSKITSYIVAILACAAYLILFSVIIVNLDFKHLGIFWKILFLWLPIVGIWKVITSLGKKKGKDNEKDDTENTSKQKSESIKDKTSKEESSKYNPLNYAPLSTDINELKHRICVSMAGIIEDYHKGTLKAEESLMPVLEDIASGVYLIAMKMISDKEIEKVYLGNDKSNYQMTQKELFIEDFFSKLESGFFNGFESIEAYIKEYTTRLYLKTTIED